MTTNKMFAVVVATLLIGIGSVNSCTPASDSGSATGLAAGTGSASPSTAPSTNTVAAVSTAAYVPINPPVQCGQTGVPFPGAGVVGGKAAAVGQFPWQALLSIADAYICGGVLIHEKWVITAAHCCNLTTKQNAIKIYLGSTTNTITVANSVAEAQRTSLRFIKHPSYRGFDNDYCLVEMATAVTFSSKIRPICLASTTALECAVGKYATISGFGNTISNTWSVSNTLQYATIPVKDRTLFACGIYYLGVSITKNMICAGGVTDVGSCSGDSGGPLACQQGAYWYLSGVTSFGSSLGCGYRSYPAVFSRIQTAYSWIKTSLASYVPGV